MTEAGAKTKRPIKTVSAKVTPKLQFEVEQFFYSEAAVLDAKDHRAWLSLIAEDIHYWMPIRRTVTNSNSYMEFTKQGAMSYFDDNYEMLEFRVKKLESSSAWSEDPASRSRHFVSNVRIVELEGDLIHTECAFHLYRTRLESEVDSFVGRREDTLRKVEGGFQLTRRHIFLDQTLILATNMSTIF